MLLSKNLEEEGKKKQKKTKPLLSANKTFLPFNEVFINQKYNTMSLTMCTSHS